MNDNKKLIHPKGYQLHVTSWENDGDNYRTKTLNIQTLEEAKAYKHICENLFQSKSRSVKAIGNFTEGNEEKVEERILAYIDEYPDYFQIDADPYDLILDIANECMGSSDFYICRVCESVEITYSEEDIWVQTIK